MSTVNWLTLPEACDRTKLSESTIDRWIKDGRLISGVHYGGSGRLRRFDAEMLDIAVRFQNDEEAHQQAISAKRRAIFGRKQAN
ncbi:MAG: helix-turn-helix domain-containing protein [Plectolyngbya sp. WJT66-NPBG17]|jgi:excisionase family DNA binding protein|nr:helix-turn-helix domain-containing protein [Plectolyngbya sp. WJT66-NPBG17]MBW4528688.1 helix-turn-helix domain-containing protein [Phormidium tanganyikae FI6-MK23]